MKNLEKFLGIIVIGTVITTGAFAQESGEPSGAEVVGTWRHEKEGLTFQFNTDGSFTMSEDSEETRKALETETRGRGEAVSTSVGGTYTVAKGVINMVMAVDGKSHRLRMKYKKRNADTLQLEGQNYRRVD
jgi:hypothetical protein